MYVEVWRKSWDWDWGGLSETQFCNTYLRIGRRFHRLAAPL